MTWETVWRGGWSSLPGGGGCSQALGVWRNLSKAASLPKSCQGEGHSEQSDIPPTFKLPPGFILLSFFPPVLKLKHHFQQKFHLTL